MITQAQAEYLLGLPKLLTENGAYLQKKSYSPSLPIRDRLFMASEQDTDFTFFLEITQSNKQHLRLSLHFQEDETSVGMLRVDFNSRHRNPEEINEFVPEAFKPFAGQWVEGNHIHYYVQGFKPLAWAIPLQVDNSFAIKQFTNETQVSNIITTFGQKVNLQTQLSITIQSRIT